MLEILEIVLLVLLLFILLLAGWIVNLVNKLASQSQIDTIQNTLQNLDMQVKPEQMTAALVQSGSAFDSAMAKSFKDLKISEDIGHIKKSAEDMGKNVTEIQSIFLDKQAAAGWAEIELERLLKDTFSSVHIRKKVPKLNSIPDAHLILSDSRILCIDSKFPLAAFRSMCSAKDGRERRPLQNTFINAVSGHIEKVFESYVRPADGTTDIAYLYIPSERIYQHMIDSDNEQESELMRDAASRGVVVCSPSTLIANMHLLNIAERAMGIAEKSDEIIKGHVQLRRDLNNLQGVWSTLSSQISNSYSNRTKLQESMDSLDRALKSLENLNIKDE